MAEICSPPVNTGTFFCQFCLEERPLADGTILSCGHRFDSSCLAAWVTARVVEGKTTFHCQYDSTTNEAQALPSSVSITLASPSGPPGICNRVIPRGEIDSILGNAPVVRSKYHRFLAQTADPSLRQCPTCGLSQSGSIANPAMTCGSCGQLYCFLHSNAHVSSTCAGIKMCA